MMVGAVSLFRTITSTSNEAKSRKVESLKVIERVEAKLMARSLTTLSSKRSASEEDPSEKSPYQENP